jgi:carboxylesterase type B
MSDTMKPTGTTTLDLGSHGQLKGSVFANGVKRFTHIPYALPPTGSRRWKKPEQLPKDYVYSSNGPLDCTQYGNVCPQPEYIVNGKSMINTDYRFDEDCLAVNVWLPPGDAPETGWPILAWIHGGWLQIGDPSLKEHTQPTQLVAEGGLNAMVVSIGYRLNIFGFLAGEGLKGNFGFWVGSELGYHGLH